MPDLVYTDAGRTLGVEIVDAYYDGDAAKMLWQAAREVPDAPNRWGGPEPDRRLLANVESQIQKKCSFAYGPNCALAVRVWPLLTSASEMEDLLRDLRLPDNVPFVAVYLLGNFPMTQKSLGGFHVWSLTADA